MPMCACFLLLSFVASAKQEYYRWKDASGTVHYSDQPPPKGISAESIHRADKSPQTDSGVAVPARSDTAAVAESDSTRLERAQRQYEKKACEAAHHDLDLLNSGEMVVVGDSTTEARKMKPAEQDAAKAEAQAKILKFCVAGGAE